MVKPIGTMRRRTPEDELNPDPLGQVERLWTREFIAVNLICLLAFGTLSIFYGFYAFLEAREVAPAWRGPIIGFFSLAALLLRPYVSTRLRPKTVIQAMVLGQSVSIISLLSYPYLGGAWSLGLVRLLHGSAYVLTLSAAMCILSLIMPPSRSGEGFGINTLMSLLPNAVLPYVAETWFSHPGDGSIYTFGALLTIPGFVVLPLLRGAIADDLPDRAGHGAAPTSKTWSQIKKGLSQRGAPALLGAFGLVFMSIVLVFFFLKPICLLRGVGDPGLFFSISSVIVIGLRGIFSRSFDKMDRKILCIAGLLAMGAALALLALVPVDSAFLSAALVFGLGMGVATPLMNSLMFLITRPDLRGLNINLMLQMVDLAYVIGPLLGGMIMSFGPQGKAANGMGLLLTSSAAAFIAAMLVLRQVPHSSESVAREVTT